MQTKNFECWGKENGNEFSSKITRNPKLIWKEPCRHPSRQRIRHKVPIGNNRISTSTLKTAPFLFDYLYPHLIHPSLDRPHSLDYMASRFNRPFCHSTPSRQTDRLTGLTTSLFQHPLIRSFDCITTRIKTL